MMRILLFLLLVPVQGFHQWTLPSARSALVALPQSSSSNSIPNDKPVRASPTSTPAVLLQRSSTAALSCMATWAAIHHAGWSIVRASSAVGLASALILPPAFSAAALCGSFAGMSAQIVTLQQTALLGLACGLVLFVWDTNQFQIGKGGRLGTIAFLGNMMFYSLRHGGPGSVLTALVRTLTPVTACTLAASSAVSIASGRKSPLLRQASKAVLLGSLFHRLVTNGVSLEKWGISAAYMFLSSLLVQRATPWNGVVLATAAVGLLGSFTPWAAVIYLGAFIGMTGRENFRARNFLEASLFFGCFVRAWVTQWFRG